MNSQNHPNPYPLLSSKHSPTDLHLIRYYEKWVFRVENIFQYLKIDLVQLKVRKEVNRLSMVTQSPISFVFIQIVICLQSRNWLVFCLLFTAPSPGSHQLRTLTFNQRLLGSPYLRDLDAFPRKSLSQLNNNSSSHQISHPNVPTLECGGYKPNAPQIQGK